MRHEAGAAPRTAPAETTDRQAADSSLSIAIAASADIPRRPCRSKGCTGSRPVVPVGSSRFFDRCPKCARRVLHEQPYPEPDPRPAIDPWAERVAELLQQAEGRWAA